MSTTKPAAHIPVKHFRQCFLWPLILANPENAPKWFESLEKTLPESGWRAVEHPFDLMPDQNGVGPYEEAVYFHDFIRNFLYSNDKTLHPNDKTPSQLAFTRPKMTHFVATIAGQKRPFTVELCALHVFDSGVAILTVELNYSGAPITLDIAQTVVDYLRRAYPPFWFAEGAPGLCPTDVDIDGKPHGLGPLTKRADALAALRENRQEPVFPWWQEILQPLTLVGAKNANTEFAMRQILDERIPVITTLSLSSLDGGSASDLAQVTEGDWWRLAFADQAGGDAFPYNPNFLRQQYPDAFYDRFAPHPEIMQDGATRFLFAGYHFAAVGAGWFFDTLIVQHTRRQYRQMMMLCVLEFATLLMLSGRLNEASRRSATRNENGALDTDATAKNAENTQNFRNTVIDIERDFLAFTHAAHFTGVSNQLQATEMFAKMRRAMHLDQLYDDVRQELDTATQFALALEQRDATQAAQKLAEEQQEATNSTHALTEVATLAAAIGVAAGLGGMNVLMGDRLDVWIPTAFGIEPKAPSYDLFQAGILLTVSACLALLVAAKRTTARLRYILRGLAALGVVAVIVGGIGMASTNSPPQPTDNTGTQTNQDPAEGNPAET